jgi:hypothetical protein
VTTFYRLDSAKLTYAEYWRLATDPFSFLVAAVRKFFGNPVPLHFAIPRPDRLFVVRFGELPAAACAAMNPPLRAAEAVGLRVVFSHRLAVPEPNRLGAATVLLDEEGTTSLSVQFGQHGPLQELHMVCVSAFADDTLAVTTTMKKTLEPVPGSHIERHPDADPPTLYARHREHLDRLADEGLIPLRLNPDRLPETVLGWELGYVDFHVGRGLFVPMTDEEVEELCDG